MNIEQRLKRLEEKVSTKKKANEGVDELYVVKKSASRKLSEIASLMKRTSVFIDNELRDLGYSDPKLESLSKRLKIDSVEYEGLI